MDAHHDQHSTGHGHGHGNDHGHDHGHDHPTGIRALLPFGAGHSHDAADSIDPALESSRDGIRAVKLSLIGLAVTAALQLVVVAISGSVALLADTVHNLGDALTAVPLWTAFVLGRRPPNRRYTYGFGRAEDLAGVVIVAMIALSALLAGWQSISRLLDPKPIQAAGWVLVAGLVGFAGNELVALYRIRVGRRIGSAALVADGLHARTDGFTSLAVVVGALGVLAGYPIIDPLMGLLITVVIVGVLGSAAREVYRRLMDAVDPELVDGAEQALRAVDGVLEVEHVQMRWIGHRIRAEVGLVANASLSLPDAHALAEQARHRLLHDVPKLHDALVHVSPADGDGVDHHDLTRHHRGPAASDRSM
jgi:cation diffusion facilitator family transporter